MASAASTTLGIISSTNPTSHPPRNPSTSIQIPSFVKLPTSCSTKCPSQILSTTTTSQLHRSPSVTPLKATPSSSPTPSTTPSTTLHGLCYVVGDNIDTDQIIPAEYLTFYPSTPEEYRELGQYALIGLPSSYKVRFIEPNEFTSKYSIIIAGANFGCGSSREHAPVALGAAGTAAVVAETYARIFFRNSVATGELYPLESEVRICEEFTTGDVATIELGENKLINHTTGKEYHLKPIGDAAPVIEAGGIFAYARNTGMMPSATA